MIRTLTSLASGVALAAVAALPLEAADLPRTELKGVGLNGPTVASSRDELPFWRETIPEASDGQVTMDIRKMEEGWNAKLLGFGGNPPQVVWCREELAGLEDLSGRKIRVFNATMTDFVQGVGGTTVNIPFAEVVPALQRGVVDCAITGSLSGNTARWWEVADYLYPLSAGWSINVHAMNLESWNALDPAVQEFLLEQFEGYEEKMWDTVQLATDEGVSCNIGEDPCTIGIKADMNLVPVEESEEAARQELLESAVLKGWARRCGDECAAEWNDTVGELLGLTAPTS
jgi:TRAP-type C4-dicarboxylate transport system substrate-binding protein